MCSLKNFKSKARKRKESATEHEIDFYFERLKSQQKTVGLYESARQIDNRSKNRYGNILPFDKTRVFLKGKNDYINASYIKGFSEKIEYIATQAPLSNTIIDFWEMVVQNNVDIIVMLTSVFENNKTKSTKYYPHRFETLTYGDISIKTNTVWCFDEYTISNLFVRNNKTHKQFPVKHIQYKGWPDFSVPKNCFILNFVNLVRQMMTNNLIVVHCSAGVGRTGTYIAADIMLQKLKINQQVDIFEIVTELRKQRIYMVQSLAQYEYLHKLLDYYFENEGEFCIGRKSSTNDYVNVRVKSVREILKSPSFLFKSQ